MRGQADKVRCFCLAICRRKAPDGQLVSRTTEWRHRKLKSSSSSPENESEDSEDSANEGGYDDCNIGPALPDDEEDDDFNDEEDENAELAFFPKRRYKRMMSHCGGTIVQGEDGVLMRVTKRARIQAKKLPSGIVAFLVSMHDSYVIHKIPRVAMEKLCTSFSSAIGSHIGPTLLPSSIHQLKQFVMASKANAEDSVDEVACLERLQVYIVKDKILSMKSRLLYHILICNQLLENVKSYIIPYNVCKNLIYLY